MAEPNGRPLWRISAAFAILVLTCHLGWAQTATAPPAPSPSFEVLPELQIIGTAPLPGTGIDRDRLPGPTWTVGAEEMRAAGPASLTESLDRLVPGLTLNDVTVSPFQPDVQFRGFSASPVLGTPAGMAVYQNGARINEAFGDTVNWNLVPDFAIRRADLLTADPVFGLNALGGALVLEMKNGFTFHGSRFELAGGSFGHVGTIFEEGIRAGNVASYIGGRLVTDGGYRPHSRAAIGQVYGDVGAESEHASLHVSVTGVRDNIRSVGPTPVELLDRDRRATFTFPQGSRNSLAFVTANGKLKANDTLDLDALFYLRQFDQHISDGNTTAAQRCDVDFAPGFLCLRSGTRPLFGLGGGQIPDFLPSADLAEIDRSATHATGFGGSLQATERAPIAGFDNHLVVGVSIDHASVGFSAFSELATLQPDFRTVPTAVVIDQPSGTIAPVRLGTTNLYLGLYASDTINLTSRLSVTLGGRFNFAELRLADRFGTALNGSHRYTRFNPMIGAAYKIAPELTAYAGYAETNRVPTPGELGCADPAHPCALNTFLVSDPGLKQVVARTIQAGLRGSGQVDLAGLAAGKLDWKLGVFAVRDGNDILNVQSPITNFGYFTNIPGTRRRGIEAGVNFKSERWSVHADYELLDATFRSALTLFSPFNPTADANGDIQVKPGDRLPSLPEHQLKAGFEYKLLQPWKIGVDLIVASSQFLRGDESNGTKPLPGYWRVDVHSQYDINDKLQAFLLIRNLFDRKYYTFGTFFETDEVGVVTLTDPRTLSPASPLAVLAGIRAVF